LELALLLRNSGKKILHGIPEEIPIFFATPVLGEKVAELGLIHNVVAVLLLIRF
jgi:hypothetical protein